MKWIISQNKKKMINVDNIAYLQIREMLKADKQPSEWRLEAVYGEEEDSFIHLGVYSDEQYTKALFVDIVCFFDQGGAYYDMPKGVV